ncbi:ABC transporter permease [Paraclostridium sordellii]|uniref:ABC transporter permease n=1 Tax=Paraclostridium sordellii TaxID=1505 RepID=UPI0005E7BB98|nr:ABC transporter permease [Paeniclostridium sordellii]CEP80654.1 ABC transporter [[Clostridium] sordellii] [Paeniclostridium sordellii]
MNEFKVLLKLGMKKRIKDSFLIGYGVTFPLMLIIILGYMATNYYSKEGGITSYYYYSMVTIPFCTFLSSITLIYVAREESLNKCGERFIIAPISKTSIVLSKIIPSTIAISVYNLILLLVCNLIFKVDYRGRFLEIYVLIISLGFMSSAFGTFIGLCSKDFMSIKNIVSTPILIMAVLGGSFFPIGSLGNVFEMISYISPLTWVNRGIFMMLNDNIINVYMISLFIILGLGMLFTIVSIKAFKKEAFI